MKWWWISFAAVIFLANPSTGGCDGVTGHMNFVAGTLHSDDDFSKAFNLDKRMELGISCDVKKQGWPVSIAFDYMFVYGDSKISKNSPVFTGYTKLNLYATEMYVGIKKIFNLFPSVKPFAAAGICTVNMYVDATGDHEYDFGVGGWVGSGAYFMLSQRLNAGFEWKWSKAEVNIFDHNYNAGGNHFNLIAGYHF